MTLEPRTAAEYTVLRLQQAAHSGSPILIPGAWEVRAPSPAAPIGVGETRPTLAAQAADLSDGKRHELEREDGRRVSFLARLWRSMLHPAEIAVI